MIETSTTRPAAILSQDELGTLRIGSIADAAVLEKQEVRFLFMDSYDQQRIGNELLIDAANSFRAAADFECDNWPTPTKL